MSASRIPFELQELIIDLIDDRDYGTLHSTLRSCALTCRAWAPRSTRRLNNHLQWRDIPEKWLNHAVSVQHPPSNVFNMIRELELWETRSDDSFHHGAVLLILARKLPCLSSLTLHDTELHSLPCRLPILASFPALTTLYLESVTLTSNVALQRMLSAAPALRRLSVCGTRWYSSHVTAPGLQSSRLRLSHLVWYSMKPRWDEDSGSELSASRGPSQDSLHFAHLIRSPHVYRSLDFLSISIEWDYTAWVDELIHAVLADPDSNPLYLRNLSALKLTLDLRFQPGEGQVSGPLESFVRLATTLLSGMQAGRLRTCTLRFRYFRIRGFLGRIIRALQSLGAEVEQALVAPGYGQLTSVVFEFEDADDLDSLDPKVIVSKFLRSLRARMAAISPELHRRGLLSVTFISWDHSGVSKCYSWLEDGDGNVKRVPNMVPDFE